MAKQCLPTVKITPQQLPAALYLVATPIGHLGDITLRALQTLASVAQIYAEDTRVSQKLLAAYGLKVPLARFDDHATAAQRQAIVAQVAQGAAVALVSDAGLPCINDPGQMLATLRPTPRPQLPLAPLAPQ